MTFDPRRQYRCTIIRGRSITVMNDLLPVYAKIIAQTCPSDAERFAKQFNEKLGRVLPMQSEKTLNNHRTENVRALLGMVYEEDGRVYSTERTDKLLADGDLPSFFKDWCFKLEFPNGMDKTQTVRERVAEKIQLRPCCFLVQLLTHMQQNGMAAPTIDEVGYYVLNALDTLQGKVTPTEVATVIAKHRKEKKKYVVAGDNTAQAMQHIRELLGYMEFANLISVEKHRQIKLNNGEAAALDVFRREPYSRLVFNAYKYDLEKAEDLKALLSDWRKYIGKVSFRDKAVFETPTLALIKETELSLMDLDTTAIGDEGEKIVYRLERARVAKWDENYVDRVKIVGATKGLGYDVHSVAAQGSKPKNAIYIEVKTTKRVGAPEIIDDAIELTRNEWECADQNRDSYWLYRVYLTDKGVYLFKIQNPAAAIDAKAGSTVRSYAVKYRVEFRANKRDLQLVKV